MDIKPSEADLFILECLQRKDEIEAVKKNIKTYTLMDIMADVCESVEVDLEATMSKCRKRPFVYCRKIYAYVACILTHFTLEKIGAIYNFKGSHHGTISHHRKDVESMLKIKDDTFMPMWDEYLLNSKVFNTNPNHTRYVGGEE